MRKENFKRMEKQPSPTQNTRHKPTLLIRPQGFSLEIENLFFLRRLRSARTPTLKGALRVVLNLSGTLLVIGAVWFLLAEALIDAHPSIEQSNSIRPNKCVALNRCVASILSTPTPPITPTVLQTPSPGAHMTPEPTPLATKTPMPKLSPTPDPTLAPTLTPATAFLQVMPKSLTISLASVCAKGQSVILTLTNAGGSPLIWFQDTKNSSRGIKILDPTKTHLLQVGTSVNAAVNCLSALAVGLYSLAIDYNGGAVTVPVKITL